MEDIKRSLRTSHKSKGNSTIRSIFGTKYQPGEDVGIFISRVKTAATRLQEAGHKLDDLYIGFQLIRWLPQEFQSTVQQIYRWKEEDFRVVKIGSRADIRSQSSSVDETRFGESGECLLEQFHFEEVEDVSWCYGCSSWRSKCQERLPKKVFNINLRFCEAECSLLELDKQLITSCILFEDFSDKGVWVIDTAATSHFCNDKSLFLDLKLISNMKMSLATEDKSCPVEGIGTLRFLGYRIWLIDENKLVETINVRFDENKRGINFRQKVNSNLGYNLNLPDYYDDEDDFDRVKDSLTSRLVSKTSTETPPTSEKPDVSSDNHSLIPCTEVKVDSKYRKNNAESQGFSDLSEQQALMVEVTIPNCYKQAIRSRDASKWHDAMDKEINVMKERKVWDLVDHPDNIKNFRKTVGFTPLNMMKIIKLLDTRPA
ncbi:retrovirus-related Pol polyprotein from transposon RE1 [Trichonephila clavipes]|nr:retrovirus-related Pol polyprotein from transposon RE1 [Trichonephila clavipes]